MKKAGKIILGIAAGIVVLGGGMTFALMKDIPTLKKLTIHSVDLSKVSDGTYDGKYSFSRWTSEVEVTVQDGKIISINRLSDPLAPDVSSQLFEKMIEEQKVDVDTVTGATATSKAYMKSVENALTQSGAAQ